MKYNLEQYLAVKHALVNEFKLTEKKVSQAWMDYIDLDADPNNPDHWDLLLHSAKGNYYINMKFFPTISIEPTHTNSYSYGKIKVKDDVTPEMVTWYVHNIMDKE